MISIVMATYDRAATLPRAISSVMAQTYADWELIIVDDGSTDGTDAVLAGLADERIHVYRHERNRGGMAAKNTGLDHMRGDWFTILDSDDEIATDALAVMAECAEQTGATAITCNCVDSRTGKMTGVGPAHDGWISAANTATYHGEFWGITRSDLLGSMRFEERLPTSEGLVWLKIDAKARRYYVHRALRVYHTEGADGIIGALGASGLAAKLRNYAVIGEDVEYLRTLKRASPASYTRLMVRVRIARLFRLVIR